MNFTAGSFIDSKGLGISFRIGAIMYAIGLFGFCLINYGYHWVLIGAILIALGQPLVMNCPAKVATYWFIDKNVFFSFYAENCRYRNHQCHQFGHFGCKSCVSCHFRRIRRNGWWSQRSDFQLVFQIFHRSCCKWSSDYFFDAWKTQQTAICRCWTRENYPLKNLGNHQGRQKHLEILHRRHSVVWNIFEFWINIEHAFQALWFWGHSDCHIWSVFVGFWCYRFRYVYDLHQENNKIQKCHYLCMRLSSSFYNN